MVFEIYLLSGLLFNAGVLQIFYLPQSLLEYQVPYLVHRVQGRYHME